MALLSVAVGSPADSDIYSGGSAGSGFNTSLQAARMADLMAQAKLQRPDLAAAVAQRDAAAANVTVARAVGRPSISLQGGRSGSNTTGVANQNYSQIGIYVTVPIFTGFKVDYGVRQAQAALESREVNVDKVILQVTSDVWNAYYSLDSAAQSQELSGNIHFGENSRSKSGSSSWTISGWHWHDSRPAYGPSGCRECGSSSENRRGSFPGK